MELKEGTVYLIRHNEEKFQHFEGIFKDYISVPYGEGRHLAPRFINCYCYNRTHDEKVDNYSDSSYSIGSGRNDLNMTYVFCDIINTRYYDSKKVKNVQKAIQQRERRTVNMILRRLIGDEHFEW